MSENDPLTRAALFSSLLARLTPENAKTAFEALKASRGRRRGFGRGGGNEMSLLLTAWGRVDGAGVIEELTALREARDEEGGGRGRGRGFGGFGGAGGDGGGMDFFAALSGWATADGDAAGKYVAGLEDDRQRTMYTASLVSGLMVNGVDEAVEFIGRLPEDDGSRGRYMSMVANEVLGQGLEAATGWVDSLSDPGLKGGALSQVAREYARSNLDEAVDWVSKYAGEEYAASAVTAVAREWADDDPEAAVDWAAGLPESAQASAFEEALDQWTEKDAFAASEYLSAMPASPARDSAVHGFASELAREDGASAIEWAQTIADETLRTETVTDVVSSWYRNDKTAAGTWLETSGLPQETQQKIFENSERRDFGRGGFGRGRR